MRLLLLLALGASAHSGASKISFVDDIIEAAGSNMENILLIMTIFGCCWFFLF